MIDYNEKKREKKSADFLSDVKKNSLLSSPFGLHRVVFFIGQITAD
jgi:hypothetical protein